MLLILNHLYYLSDFKRFLKSRASIKYRRESMTVNIAGHAVQSGAFSCLPPLSSFVKSLSINGTMTTLAPIIVL